MSTILVVDDEPPILAALLEALRDEGHATLSAIDGLAARTVLETTVPGLVVSDVMMPGLGGLELIRWMRGRPATRDVPVILTSAIRSPDLAGLGRVSFIGKPFDLAALLARVEAELSESPGQRRTLGKTG